MKGAEFLQDAFADIDDELILDAKKRIPAVFASRRRPILAVAASLLLIFGTVLPLAVFQHLHTDPSDRPPIHTGPLCAPPSDGGGKPVVEVGAPYAYGDYQLFDISSPTYSQNAAFGAHYDEAFYWPIERKAQASHLKEWTLLDTTLTLELFSECYYVSGDYVTQRYRVKNGTGYVELYEDGRLHSLEDCAIPLPNVGELADGIPVLFAELTDFYRFTEVTEKENTVTFTRKVDGYTVDDAFVVVCRNGVLTDLKNKKELKVPSWQMTDVEIDQTVAAHLAAVYANSDRTLASYGIERISLTGFEEKTVLCVEVSHWYFAEDGALTQGRLLRVLIEPKQS